MKKAEFPPRLFINRRDCESALMNPNISFEGLIEYAPHSLIITGTETYIHTDQVKSLLREEAADIFGTVVASKPVTVAFCREKAAAEREGK